MKNIRTISLVSMKFWTLDYICERLLDKMKERNYFSRAIFEKEVEDKTMSRWMRTTILLTKLYRYEEMNLNSSCYCI